MIGIIDYLNMFDKKAGFDTKILFPTPPLGQAGDRFLIQAIHACVFDPRAYTSYIVPVVRPEKQEDLMNGSHLSLFYLYMFVFGKDAETEIVNKVYKAITNVTNITVSEILNHTELSFSKGQFSFVKKYIEPAKGFPYSNNAYEMFDEKGVEIGNISKFINEDDGSWTTVFAFGFERLIMHYNNSDCIWHCPPFNSIQTDTHSSELDMLSHDTLRRTEVLSMLNHEKGSNDVLMYSNTYLPERD